MRQAKGNTHHQLDEADSVREVLDERGHWRVSMSFELCVEPTARASETTIYARIYKGQAVPFAESPLLDFIRITHGEG